jgi:hypothetical protein
MAGLGLATQGGSAEQANNSNSNIFNHEVRMRERYGETATGRVGLRHTGPQLRASVATSCKGRTMQEKFEQMTSPQAVIKANTQFALFWLCHLRDAPVSVLEFVN